jgi:hypothetical protein
MTYVANASKTAKKIQDPCAEYETLLDSWRKSRAFISGQDAVKAYDGTLDLMNFRNILIPFSTKMSHSQYKFYKAEAELPGITAEFSKMISGGLMRKPPTLEIEGFSDTDRASILDWLKEEIGEDERDLMSFLNDCLSEEVQTNRSWIQVDYPKIDPEVFKKMTESEKRDIKPYPILHKAEDVINWQISKINGRKMLTKVIIKVYEEEEDPSNEFHPRIVQKIYVHKLENNVYRIAKYKEEDQTTNVPVVSGARQAPNADGRKFILEEVVTPLMHDNAIDFIPIWPLNGNYDPEPPLLTAFIDKEAALYNKISRRNHLLYGAATYTPYVVSDLSDDKFQSIVDKGLGSWFKLPLNSSANVLSTPTEALADMEKAIASGYEEIAKIGVRMLSPETDQSGVALDIRNASQTAKLGNLSARVSQTMSQVFKFMIMWRFDLGELNFKINFKITDDFDNINKSIDWMRLITEWYQASLIPRSTWIMIAKNSDALPHNYDDEKGKEEIQKDEEAVMAAETASYVDRMRLEQSISQGENNATGQN